MESLLIEKSEVTQINSFTRIGDLVNFEGPLLTLFEKASNGHLYLFDWVDRDNSKNRWLVYRISSKALFQFINKQISHLDLFYSSSQSKIYISDIDSVGNLNGFNLQEVKEVPVIYLPKKESYFDENDCPQLKKIEDFTSRVLSRESNNEYDFSLIAIKSLTSDSLKPNSSFLYISFHNNTFQYKSYPLNSETIYNRLEEYSFLNSNFRI